MTSTEKAMRRKKTVHRNGWMLLFIAVSLCFYCHFVSKKKNVIAFLNQQLSVLQIEKEALVQQKEDLVLQINSQSDPDWIKLTLMKGLGLVPEGQLKVYFHHGEGS